MYIMLKEISKDFLEVCKTNDWARNWSNGGCYLHLEVSEFIEALRGKGNPIEEAGDVFFVFLSMLAEHGINPNDCIASAQKKIIERLSNDNKKFR